MFLGMNSEGEYNPLNGVDTQWAHLPVTNSWDQQGFAGKPLRSGHAAHVRDFVSARFMAPASSRRRIHPREGTGHAIVPDLTKAEAAARHSQRKTGLAANYRSMSREVGGVVPTMALDSEAGEYEVPSNPLRGPIQSNFQIIPSVHRPRHYGSPRSSVFPDPD